MKTAGPVLMRAGIRTGSAVGTMWLAKKITTPNAEGKSIIPEKATKFVGPAFMALGLLGEVFIADENLRSVAEGMTVAGGIRTAGDLIMPDKKEALGLSGLGTATSNDMVDGNATNWDSVLEEARRIQADEAMNGPDADEEPIHGPEAEEELQGSGSTAEMLM